MFNEAFFHEMMCAYALSPDNYICYHSLKKSGKFEIPKVSITGAVCAASLLIFISVVF